MSIAMPSAHSSYSLNARLPMYVPPLAALIYPFFLVGFNASVTTITKGGFAVVSVPWLAAAVCLLLVFAVPAVALLAATRLAQIEEPTIAQRRAKRMALVAVAAPTLFTFIGVVLYMLHDPIPDTWFWIACWAIAIVMLFRAENDAAGSLQVLPVPAPLRIAHGISALGIIVIFLALHMVNHLTGLLGPDIYNGVMKMFRHVYRTDVLQPILVALLLFQIGTGLYFVWCYTAAPSDRFRTFQIASGVYLAFYVLGHMDSVFIFARTYLGIDTGWDFATGAPTGLIKDAWNIRLVPHYWLGVFFVLSHLATGARAVMLTHGIGKGFADRFMIGSAVTASLIATLIILGMCGLRVQFV